jgi:hypothetical protein
VPADFNSDERLIDFVTGKHVPNVGAEANRQAVERLLVEEKGFDRQEIEVEVPIELAIAGEIYRSAVDLVVRTSGRRVMALRCAAGSLASCGREIVAAARLLEPHQIPLAAVSDGKRALVFDTLSGRLIGEGVEAIPTKRRLQAESLDFQPLPGERRLRESLIFRTYDRERVNRIRCDREI